VRLQASTCFGALVALLPLAHGAPTPPGLDDAQKQTVEQDTAFLMQVCAFVCVCVCVHGFFPCVLVLYVCVRARARVCVCMCV